MADFCVECADCDGRHDFPLEMAWYLCEGCGAHIFERGKRLCGPGGIDPDTGQSDKLTSFLETCDDCARVVRTRPDG